MSWVLAAIGLGLAAVFVAVRRFGARDRAGPAGAIVVLGARVLEGGAPSGALRRRTLHALELYRRGLAPRIVFTGGVVTHPPAEAVVARQLALAAGVPPGACVLEDRSRTTAENAAFAAALLRPLGIEQVVLVSDPYHLLRASRLFLRAGLMPLPSPAPLIGRGQDRLRWTLREAVVLFLQPQLLFFRSRRE